MVKQLVESIAEGLRAAIDNGKLPDGFYDSSTYTDNDIHAKSINRCHPVTLGLLFPILSNLPGVKHVGIDVHINLGGKKIQPDLVGFCEDLSLGKEKHLVYVDFESPNSSDERVFKKDVEPYKKSGSQTPYIIVTSLPDKEAPKWGLGYTNDGNWNCAHKNSRKDIKKNPFSYWSKVWRADMKGMDLSTVAFININGKEVKCWDPTKSS